MKIYLSTWLLEQSQGTSLTNKGCKYRLLSYFHSKIKKLSSVKKYIINGYLNKGE